MRQITPRVLVVKFVMSIIVCISTGYALDDTPGYHQAMEEDPATGQTVEFMYYNPETSPEGKRRLLLVCPQNLGEVYDSRKHWSPIIHVIVRAKMDGWHIVSPSWRHNKGLHMPDPAELHFCVDEMLHEFQINRNNVCVLGVEAGVHQMIQFVQRYPDLVRAAAGFNEFPAPLYQRHAAVVGMEERDVKALTEGVSPTISLPNLQSTPLLFELTQHFHTQSRESVESFVNTVNKIGGQMQVNWSESPELLKLELEHVDRIFDFFDEALSDTPALPFKHGSLGALNDLQMRWMGGEELFTYSCQGAFQYEALGKTTDATLELKTLNLRRIWFSELLAPHMARQLLADQQKLDWPSVKNANRRWMLERDRPDGTWRFTTNNVDEKAMARKSVGFEGPVGDIFWRNFVLVYGDQSRDMRHNRAAREAAEDLRMFCKTRLDYEVKTIPSSRATIQLLNRHHLIFIGSPSSHKPLRVLQRELPVRVEDKYVDGVNGTYPGDKFLVDFIVPNPRNAQRYLRVISAQNPKVMRYAMMRIKPLDNYDFVVLDDKSRCPGLAVEIGRFDPHWQPDRKSVSQRSTVNDQLPKTVMLPIWKDLTIAASPCPLTQLNIQRILAMPGMVWLNQDPLGNTLTLGGSDEVNRQTVESGLCLAPTSHLVYDLKKQASRLKGRCGILSNAVTSTYMNDAALTGNGVRFEIRVDSVKVYESPYLAVNSAPEDIDIPLSGAHRIELLTECKHWSSWDAGLPVWAEMEIHKVLP